MLCYTVVLKHCSEINCIVMASLLNIDRVQYVIDNEKQEMNSLARLYFCIYCKSMKSTDTLQLEVSCIKPTSTMQK